MDEYQTRILTFLRENLFAVLCFGVGLIFFAYGVIAYSSSSASEQDVVFEASSGGENEARSEDNGQEVKMVVDVSGAVAKPGVYTLDAKSRIEDALLAAGGVTEQADQAYIARSVNLASILSDGAKVYIPFADEGGSGVLGISGGTRDKNGKVGINSASSSELERLPGIGKVTAEKMIKGRLYLSVDELVLKKIVSQKVFDQIKAEIEVF